MANIGSDEILGETRHLTEVGKGVCVGRPVAGVTVHVIRISDDPIPEWSDTLCVPPGTVGEFVVRGPVVTQRYFRRDAATRLAKILDKTTGEVLHRIYPGLDEDTARAGDASASAAATPAPALQALAFEEA